MTTKKQKSFDMTSKKRSSCIFLKLGTISLKSKNVERHFSRIL